MSNCDSFIIGYDVKKIFSNTEVGWSTNNCINKDFEEKLM